MWTAACVLGALALPAVSRGSQTPPRPASPAGAIWGTVVDSQGQPVAGARVVLEPGSREAISDAGGGFRFDGLLGGMNVAVRATKGDASSVPWTGRIESRVPYQVTLKILGEVAPASKPPVAKPVPPPADVDVSPLVVMIRGTLGDAGEVLGAGIIVGRGNGRIYIATADHVVRRANDTMRDLKVSFKWLPGETSPGEVTGDHDSRLDLAVVIVKDAPDLPAEQPLAIIGAPPVRKDSVFTIGHPNGQRWFMGAAPDTVLGTVGDMVQFQSVFIAPGNSGGALVNAQSQLIGMVTQDDPPQGRAVKIQSALERVRQWGYPVTVTEPR